MSYILEALQRSEEERARTAPPDVNVRHAPPPHSVAAPMRTRLLNWSIGTILAVNAALLALWVARDEPNMSGAPLTAPPVTTQGRPAQTAAASSEPAASPEARSAPVPAPSSAQAPVRSDTTAPARMAAPQIPEPRESELPATGTPAPAGDETSGAPQAPATAPAAAPAQRRVAEPLRRPAPAPEQEAEPPLESESAPLAIRDLPNNVQRRVPPLEFATHLYAPNPRFREVTINGRRYGQGERVEGMLLSEITPTGVVFQHAGYTFSVSVLEDWDY